MTLALAIFDLLVLSSIDWPLMVLAEGLWPHPPNLDEISPGSWYHKAKGFWSQCYRDDGEWWSKFTRFIAWWWVVLDMAL